MSCHNTNTIFYPSLKTTKTITKLHLFQRWSYLLVPILLGFIPLIFLFAIFPPSLIQAYEPASLPIRTSTPRLTISPSTIFPTALSSILSNTASTNGLETTASWLSGNSDETYSLAWGDINGDGYLDLAAGNCPWDNNNRGTNKVYLNQNGNLQTDANDPILFGGGNECTRSFAWGDIDADGDLDLAVGNDGQHNYVYINDNGTLQLTPIWTDTLTESTYSMAWGDVDADGDLDLAVGNNGQPNRVYTNSNGTLSLAWTFTITENTHSVAWGDVDADGDLDLAIGNDGQPNHVYTNSNGILSLAWTATITENTYSVAWGDVDADGRLDLAVSNFPGANNVYYNTGLGLQSSPGWTSNDSDYTYSVAWGDFDNDGDLDLAAGNTGVDPNKVYQNEGGVLQSDAVWVSSDGDLTRAIAWGDANGNGTFDLAAGNGAATNKIYFNWGSLLQPTAIWSDTANIPLNITSTYGLAWGDVNGDGALDLAFGNCGINQVYLNANGMLSTTTSWLPGEKEDTRAVAWGDVDGDGDLDLAVGNNLPNDSCHPVGATGKNHIFLNEGGVLSTTASWSPDATEEATYSVAWGDVDGDGDLDLAVGNWGGKNRIYFNTDGELKPSPDWSSSELDATTNIVWGDIDGDGDLDLAVGNVRQPNKLYRNIQGVLEITASWESGDVDVTRSVAWGDVDGDGDLDLAVGNWNGENKVYLNQNGELQTTEGTIWRSGDSDATFSIAWEDVDGDGDLDLTAGNGGQGAGGGQANKIYLNINGVLQTAADSPWISSDSDRTWSLAWGDMDGDGNPDLAVGNLGELSHVYLRQRPALLHYPEQPPTAVRLSLSSDLITGTTATSLASANFYATSGIRDTGIIPITYTLYHPASLPMRLRASYSLDGGGQWLTAIAVSNTITTNLAASPYPSTTITNTHVFNWDVYASEFFGQSDNVIFRIEAWPDLHPILNHLPNIFQHPYVSAQTYPFRVRGTQVRVYSETVTLNNTVANAIVYRLSEGQTNFEPIGNINKPFYTDEHGYLQGRGDMKQGDQLIALFPVTTTESYTLYHTNATPTLIGLEAFTVTASGVQELVVSATNPLILFNLDVSLEWDARNDPAFLERLQRDLGHTSELLYDWSNGQAALGNITIYHDREQWNDADIQIYVTNQLRPNAAVGGIVPEEISDSLAISITYQPGQVHMPIEWNQFGNSGNGTPGYDWPRGLAHELGHYLFFLEDNYLGVDDTGLVIPINTCPGAMTNPYNNDDNHGYDEFHPQANWERDCENTLANQETGRSDWETIPTFYPALFTPTITNTGPNRLPLAITQIQVITPVTPSQTLPSPIFNLLSENGSPTFPGKETTAYLLQSNQARVIDLGQPIGDIVYARGARSGDRLCVFELSATQLGCIDVGETNRHLTLHTRLNWQPDVRISPATSRTINILIANVPTTGITLQGQIYPVDGTASTMITLTQSGNGYSYTGTFSLNDPVLAGHLHLWIDEDTVPRREIIIGFGLGGSPGFKRGENGSASPVVFPNGQIIIYAPGLEFDDGEFFTLHSATTILNAPEWVTMAGQAYWLSTSEHAPSLDNASIVFNYLENDVPPGEEDLLKVWFYNEGESIWEPLTTTLNTDYNLATAPARQEGLYALMSSYEIILYGPGWNDFSYPNQDSRPITEALASIKRYYSIVWSHDAGNPDALWKMYDPDLPEPWATPYNDLTYLKSGAYWIYITDTVTLYLKGDSESRVFHNLHDPQIPKSSLEISPTVFYGPEIVGSTTSFPTPPMVVYGWITPTGELAATVGMSVTAEMSEVVCGQAPIENLEGNLGYALQVSSSDECGNVGGTVVFKIDGQILDHNRTWDDTQAWCHPLTVIKHESYIFLPIILK